MASAWGVSWASAWGDSWGAIGAVTPAVEIPVTGIGPGWNLFHPVSTRKRRIDDLEGEIREAVAKAEEAQSPRAVRKAVKELREVAKAAIAERPNTDDARFAAMVATLQQIQAIQLSARAYMERVAEMLRRQDEEDFEALVLMVIAA